MYAAHFAAGLAVKGRAQQAPVWALLTAAFLPDFLWIVFARLGLEPEYPPRGFFDDWSHSVVMILVWTTLFAALFWRRGRGTALAVWVAGLSHILLDSPIHPRPLALWPGSRVRFGWDLWRYGQQKGWLGLNHYWWVEALAVTVLLALYVSPAQRRNFPLRLTAASCVLVIGLHLISAA